MKKNRYFLFIALWFLAACNGPKNSPVETAGSDSTHQVVVIEKDQLLKDAANAVLDILRNKRFSELGERFCTGTVVRFSPYGYIDTSAHLALSAAMLDSIFKNNFPLTWGTQDGSGDPIRLPAQKYFEKYVYDVDFAAAPFVSIDSIVKSGNTVNNLKQVYPGTRFVEYHFSGFDKKLEGMDWKSLRLVFREVNGNYCLVAVVHDQWTI